MSILIVSVSSYVNNFDRIGVAALPVQSATDLLQPRDIFVEELVMGGFVELITVVQLRRGQSNDVDSCHDFQSQFTDTMR